ncbi:serine/threonine-protein kinase [Ancylothrix sp. C2]|uniref:serine/threonine-protein kinase n=1 Tax=Ancylothrix sp. D3o TaxID=2953691 RepID=UPI0021BAF98F|nr:serine/threonine-protein kinase [Ancylothrix sp. D3o]MCT7950936.1 serine/threonine-protein kinase [Ancylothrix sp. D3o]
MGRVRTLTLLDRPTQKVIQQWHFDNEPVIRIGRSPDNQVVIDDLLVSRFHAELRLTEDDKWLLVNHGTNGTFINGNRVSQSVVSDGILIELAKGGPILRLEISSPGCTHSGNPPGNLFCIHCGAPVKVERTIHQYLILRTLGKGGMGTTYLACERPTTKGKPPQLLVVKEMNADMAKIAKARELFEREARILQGLNHAGIPKFFDFFVEENKKYLAMELIHGQDLERKIYERGPVLPAIAIEWMIQTCEVLDYIHSQIPPIIHRDIKPANLMVRHIDNRVVVLDFGAVKEIGTPLGTRIGAPDYSAPEQNRGQPLTQSDLYAIGPTLIFLLTGQSPHQYYGRREQEYRFNVEKVPTITPQLRSVIDRVTEPKPSNRYQTARELSKALAACL